MSLSSEHMFVSRLPDSSRTLRSSRSVEPTGDDRLPIARSRNHAALVALVALAPSAFSLSFRIWSLYTQLVMIMIIAQMSGVCYTAEHVKTNHRYNLDTVLVRYRRCSLLWLST